MAPTRAITESPNTSFGPVTQIAAGVLDVGYVDAGSADGSAIVLLHGWPYDIHSYEEVTPRLAAAGYRVIVPFVRGYGTRRFLSETTVRNGEQAVLALDTVALMDALGLETAIVAGLTGAREPPTSSPRSGPNASAAWCR